MNASLTVLASWYKLSVVMFQYFHESISFRLHIKQDFQIIDCLVACFSSSIDLVYFTSRYHRSIAYMFVIFY